MVRQASQAKEALLAEEEAKKKARKEKKHKKKRKKKQKKQRKSRRRTKEQRRADADDPHGLLLSNAGPTGGGGGDGELDLGASVASVSTLCCWESGQSGAANDMYACVLSCFGCCVSRGRRTVKTVPGLGWRSVTITE